MSKSLNDTINENGGQRALETSGDETQLNAFELIAQYGGKSEDELMNALMNVISQQKQEGVFDAAQAEAMAQSILPMLNAEQAKKLGSILEMLK